MNWIKIIFIYTYYVLLLIIIINTNEISLDFLLSTNSLLSFWLYNKLYIIKKNINLIYNKYY